MAWQTDLIDIGAAMRIAGVPLDLVSHAIVLSEEFGDILQLMRASCDDPNVRRREFTLAAIRQLIIDGSP